MPRKPRFYLPEVPAHIVQRGNDRRPVFFADNDYHAYVGWLREGANRHGCLVHAYVLMTNHIHLLVTPSETTAISRTIQFVGRNYVTHINKTYERTGTLWEGRHKGSVIDSSAYALACSRYIEMNPVRAGLVDHPSAYRWSSFHRNAHGCGDEWLTPLAEYQSLGGTAGERQRHYRDLFDGGSRSIHLQAIRSSVQTGTPLGDDRFRTRVEAMLGCSVGHNRRGRPGKNRQPGAAKKGTDPFS